MPVLAHLHKLSHFHNNPRRSIYAYPYSKIGIYHSFREGNWGSEKGRSLPKIALHASGQVWPSKLGVSVSLACALPALPPASLGGRGLPVAPGAPRYSIFDHFGLLFSFQNLPLWWSVSPCSASQGTWPGLSLSHF